MSTITINIDGIAGESLIHNHVDELEAVTISDVVAGGGGYSRAYVSEIALTRFRDRGSPILAHACSTGANIGTAKIFLFHNVEVGTVPFMSYELSNTIVSRYEVGTVDAAGQALGLHVGFSGMGAPSWRAGYAAMGHSVNDYRAYAIARATPRPVYPAPRTTSVDKEVERVWFSADLVRWTIEDGSVSKGWDLQAGMEAA